MAETIKRLEKRVAELEARLGQTPQNSSLPPSSQHPHNKPALPRSNSKRKRGGQAGHPRHQRVLIPAENCAAVHDHTRDGCRRCGEELTGSDPAPIRHQVWEIPKIKPIVNEHRRHRLTCACCGASTCAELPEGVPAHQSGPPLVAFTAALMGVFRHSKRRTALFVEAILGIPCSAGLVVKLQKRATRALAGCYAQLAAALPRASAINLDETGTKQSGERGWIWVAATKSYTLLSIRLTRASEVVRDLLGKTSAGRSRPTATAGTTTTSCGRSAGRICCGTFNR